VAMTANALESDRERALAAGMDDYIAKPVRPEELQEVLDRWVEPAGDGADEGPQGPFGEDEAAGIEAGPGAGAAEEPLDPAVIEGLRELQGEGEPDILAELVGLFLQDVGPRLAALSEAVRGGDAGGVRQVAHTLKGSCSNMGARRMGHLCAVLQDRGASGDLSGAGELLESLKEEYARVRPALERLA
jgi:two-component system, sensor histidine kinase and response regulator